MAQTDQPCAGGYQDSPTDQLAQILDATQDAIMAISLIDRRLIYKSASFEQVFGYDVQAFIDDPHFANRFVHPDDLALTMAAQAAALRDGFAELDHRVVFPSGEVRWLHRRARVLFDAEKRPVQVIDSARDITARKVAEAAQRASAESLQQQKSFLEILLAISSRLITMPAHELNATLRTTLAEIGAFLQTDRIHIFEYDFARSTTSVTHEWCAEGIASQIQNLQDIPLAGLETWVTTHKRGEPVEFPDVHDLDSADMLRKIVKVVDLRSLHSIPLLDDGVCIGFVTLVTAHTPRHYGEADRQFLQLFAQLLVNIRSRMNTRKALAASEERYRQIVETAHEGIWMLDLAGRTVYLNQRTADMLGYSVAEVMGSDLFMFMDPDVRPQAEYYLERRRQGIQEQHDFRFKHKDGSDLWVIINTNPVCDDEGRPVSILGMLTDITARKQVEAALQEANCLLEERIAERTAELQEERSLLHAVIDAMSEGLVVHGKDGAVKYCNRAALQLFGVTVDQLVGETAVDFLVTAGREDGSSFAAETHPALAALRRGEPQANVVIGARKPDGTPAWILVNSQPLVATEDQEHYAVVSTFGDVTTLKEAEVAVAGALAAERELGELKSRFVSMASHEFRNPLAGILTTVETLSLLWEQMDKAKIEDRLNRIRSQVIRMTEITEDVLHFTRLQTGRSKFEPTPGDLAELCDRVVADLAELPGNHDRICYDCAERPLPAVFDARILQQVIGNLLHNALKYSPSATTVHLAVAQTRGQITLCIADAGIGIPLEDLPHLFEPFHRAGNVGTIQGTGLGLAIAKEAVELHGGTIAVTSRVGEGTTFTVTVPGH